MRIFRRLTQSMSEVATLAVVAIILITLADIAMQNIFKRPVRGAFELVELLLGVVVFFGVADVFRTESNICVDVIDHFVGPRGRAGLRTFSAFVSLAFLVLLGWAMLAPAWDTIEDPQSTQEIGIPLYAYWIPILLGVAVAIMAAATALWDRLAPAREQA